MVLGVVLLALFGVGTTVGTLLGGRLGDRYGFVFVSVGLLATAALLVVFTFVVVVPVVAVVLLVLFGAITFSGGPVVQNRVIEAAREAAEELPGFRLHPPRSMDLLTARQAASPQDDPRDNEEPAR